jgi:hypothetical protein
MNNKILLEEEKKTNMHHSLCISVLVICHKAGSIIIAYGVHLILDIQQTITLARKDQMMSQ